MHDNSFLGMIHSAVERKNPPNERERARLWTEEALSLLESHAAEIEEVPERMEVIRETDGYPAGRAWGKLVSAWIRLKRGSNEEARACFVDAIGLFSHFDDKKGLTRALSGLGVVFMYFNLYDQALANLNNALALAESLEWKDMLAVVYTNLGLVYLELGDYPEASKWLKKAKSTGTLFPNNYAVNDCHLATAYAEMGKYDEAEKLLRDAVTACRKGSFRITEADVLNRYGKFLERRSDLSGAAILYAEALVIAREIGNHRLFAEIGIARGILLAKLETPASGERLLLEVKKRTRDENLPALNARALAALADIYGASMRWQEAYEASQEAANLESTIFNVKVAGQASIAKAERMAAESGAYHEEIRRLALIGKIGRAIAGAMDEESIGQILHDQMAGLMSVDAFGLAHYDQAAGILDFCYFMDGGKKLEPFSLPIDSENSLTALCTEKGEEIIINDSDRESGNFVKELINAPGIEKNLVRSLLFFPVKLQGKTIAIISAQSFQAGAYKAHHQEILRAVCAYVGVALENARLFSEVKQVSGTDSLTCINNRRRFMEMLTVEMDRIHRYRGELSFIIFDLDLFKQVNDRHGHAAGDAVLKVAASLASMGLRSTDFLARYGGEEFVIALPATDGAGALIVAERVRQAFESARVALADGGEIGFTASFGLTSLSPDDNFDSLVMRADNALYRAKNNGRNRVEMEFLKKEP